ncbi:hypothetical protein F5888DRAFT_1801044 [Russula emetica]|nr:hypothetical protein F5888DRAFT_1801044 [Russula emetica]
MHFTDILSFCFSILGLYGLVYYLRFLIPRNLLPYVSAVLTEAEHLLDRAESTGVIPRPNEYRSALTLYKAVMPLPTDGHLTDRYSYSNQFLWIRMESHRSPGILQQLRLAIQYGLSCRLYMLSSRVVAIKVEIKAPLLWDCVPQRKLWYEQCRSTTFLAARGYSLNIRSNRSSFFVFEFLKLVRLGHHPSDPTWTMFRIFRHTTRYNTEPYIRAQKRDGATSTTFNLQSSPGQSSLGLTSPPSPPPAPLPLPPSLPQQPQFSAAQHTTLESALPKTLVCIGRLNMTALIVYPSAYLDISPSEPSGSEPNKRMLHGEIHPGENFAVTERRVASVLGPILGKGKIRGDSRIRRGS